MKKKPSTTVGIIVNPRKEQALAPLLSLDQWIGESGVDALFLLCTYQSPYITSTFDNIKTTTAANLLKRSDVIITLGGDGTILRTVQVVGDLNIPILGVNLGGLGFLAETAPEMLITHLEMYFRGQHILEERALLNCKVMDTDQTFFAFNDIVIDKAGFSRVIEIVTHVDDRLLNSYIADALIVSTPAGSTGYSLSAGGPIVIPETEVFIINPICPHSLTNRPVVVPDSSIITLTVLTEFKEINVFRDGQMVERFPSGVTFKISRAAFTVKLVKMKEKGFYETLSNKLHWGEDFRDKNRWSYQK